MFKKDKPIDNKTKIRTEMQYRRVKANLESYARRCQNIANDYLEKGKQAAKVKDITLMRQFAIGYRTMTEKRLAAEKILLSMESMNLNMDHDEVAKSFLDYSRLFHDLSGTGKIQAKDYEKMLEEIQRNDSSLNRVIDALNDRMSQTDESHLDDILSEMTKDEKESDIEKKLDGILEMMKERTDRHTKRDADESEKAKLRELLDLLDRKYRPGSAGHHGEIMKDIEDKLREIERHIGSGRGKR